MTSDPRAVLERLYQLAPRGAELGLSRMQAACTSWGVDLFRAPTVHVAGTNGKGSVCATLAAMARAAGMRAGLYTSPHLCRFAERIQIDGRPVSDELLAQHLEQVLDRAPDLSFFETATLTAFLAFASAEVDLVVLEVGLGGRLDATNVVPSPAVTCITRIALDHTATLGSTIAQIAAEKAGIIKPLVPLVVGNLSPEARDPILAVAAERRAPIVNGGDGSRWAEWINKTPRALQGEHQRDNALLAATAGDILGFDERALRQGLVDVHWPGRLERIETADGAYLLDAAHNPDGARALTRWLSVHAPQPHQNALIFGAMWDKDWQGMLDPLCGVALHRFFCEPEGRRPREREELRAFAAGHSCDSLREALPRARSSVGRCGLVVITGSIFLVGEARAILLGLERDPQVAL